MYLIVAKDTRVPLDLLSADYEMWSINEFMKKATSDDGVDTGQGIYFNIDCLTLDIYEGLTEYKAAGITIVYYVFSDQNIHLPFSMNRNDEIITYNADGDADDEAEDEEVEDTSDAEQETEDKSNVKETPSVEQFTEPYEIAPDIGIASVSNIEQTNLLDEMRLRGMLDENDSDEKARTGKPAKVIIFGSSKGGTGKTFTCLMTVFRFARKHPDLKIALADFDIIDGQIGININRITPTVADFYKQYNAGNDTFSYLHNCSLHNEHFSSNLDFYLAPPMDIPALTNDTAFWKKVFELLIVNYDVVFFDTGIDYLGKEPISKLYKIADKIIITCNPSINSVKSIIKQFKTLSGQRQNPVFSPEDKIMDRVYVVLTRVYEEPQINNIVVSNISKYADVIAAFGQIDSLISKVQWFQQWELISANPNICRYLDTIAHIDGIDEDE